jgi:hypothetical protein
MMAVTSFIADSCVLGLRAIQDADSMPRRWGKVNQSLAGQRAISAHCDSAGNIVCAPAWCGNRRHLI